MRYEIRVDGILSDEDRAAFAGMRIIEMLIDGEVADESHLHGIIAQLDALGFSVVSVMPGA